MKNTFARQFPQLLFFLFFLISSIMGSELPGTISQAASFPSNKTGKKMSATSIHRGRHYESTIAVNGVQYFCLLGQEDSGDILINLDAKKAFSFTFQLMDKKGIRYSPGSYTLGDGGHHLSIRYHFKANQNYMFGLCNNTGEAVTYTICYQEVSGASGQDSNAQEQKEKQIIGAPEKQTISAPTPKPVRHKKTKAVKTSSAATNSSTKSHTTSKPSQSNTSGTNATRKKQMTAAKQKSTSRTTPTPTLSLSKTMVCLRQGQRFSITGYSNTQASALCWSCSMSGAISGKARVIKSSPRQECYQAKTLKPGVCILTCRIKGTPSACASCTIKIAR